MESKLDEKEHDHAHHDHVLPERTDAEKIDDAYQTALVRFLHTKDVMAELILAVVTGKPSDELKAIGAAVKKLKDKKIAIDKNGTYPEVEMLSKTWIESIGDA